MTAPAPATSLPPEANASQSQAPSKPKSRISPALKRKLLIGLGIVALIGVTLYIYDSLTHEETDDAYVTGHLHYVAPRVAGTIQQVSVEDNQLVHQGDVLARLDPADNQTDVAEYKSVYERTKADYDRDIDLIKTNAISQQQLDHDKSNFDAALAQLAKQQLQVDYTTIIAPATGRVGRKNVEVGNRVQVGQTLLVIVENDLWVVANFKETQLAHMKEGLKVRLRIDAIPGVTFWGTVESFSPASGNQFALLPADNSTGNFTKIVQRVPVKIRFDADSLQGYEERVRAGLSVMVKVAL